MAPAVHHYKMLSSNILDVKRKRDTEVSKLSALQKQLETLPSRIAYCEMTVNKLQKQYQYFIDMREYTKSKMSPDEKRLL